jgi:uncharacterized membrane protein
VNSLLTETRRPALVRLVISAAAGAAAGLLLSLAGLDEQWFEDSSLIVALSAGWTVGALVYVGLSAAHLWHLDGPKTHAWATREDPSRGWSRSLVLTAALVALAAVGALISKSQTGHGGSVFLVAGLAVAAVFAAWLLIHTVYALRYAEMYFGFDGDAGARAAVNAREAEAQRRVKPIDFPGVDQPTYADFAYFSFNLGLTFQVSDTTVGRTALRKVIMVHCILSYLYSTAILASIINMVIGLVQNSH